MNLLVLSSYEMNDIIYAEYLKILGRFNKK